MASRRVNCPVQCSRRSGLARRSGPWLKGCFTSTETVGLLGTGAKDGHLDFHTVLSSEVDPAQHKLASYKGQFERIRSCVHEDTSPPAPTPFLSYLTPFPHHQQTVCSLARLVYYQVVFEEAVQTTTKFLGSTVGLQKEPKALHRRHAYTPTPTHPHHPPPPPPHTHTHTHSKSRLCLAPGYRTV